MHVLVLYAHPEPKSFNAALKEASLEAIAAAGHTAEVSDLYAEGFNPVAGRHDFSTTADPDFFHYQNEQALAAREGGFSDELKREQARVDRADAFILHFPLWWGGPPAILKGWFDRVWGPGIAYDHADDLGAIRPRLTRLRYALAVTTLGSPWWVDWFILRRPVRRVLKTALLGTCAPACRFEMLSLYRSEKLAPETVTAFARRIARTIRHWD